MKKNIYGFIDSRTSNIGDICLLDRDEEFLEGAKTLLMNPAIPNYLVEDLDGVCYGSISFDSDQLFPKFDILPIPTLIIAGRDLTPLRKDVHDEKVSENS